MEINGKKINKGNSTIGRYRQNPGTRMYIHEPDAYTTNLYTFSKIEEYAGHNSTSPLYLINTEAGMVAAIHKPSHIMFILTKNDRQYWQQIEWETADEKAIAEVAHRFARMINAEHSAVEKALA